MYMKDDFIISATMEDSRILQRMDPTHAHLLSSHTRYVDIDVGEETRSEIARTATGRSHIFIKSINHRAHKSCCAAATTGVALSRTR